MEFGSYFLFQQEQIKDIIIIDLPDPPASLTRRSSSACDLQLHCRLAMNSESSLAGLWLPNAGGDGAWTVRTGSGPMWMCCDI